MDQYYELEKNWLKYKRKSIVAKIFVPLTLTAIISASGIYYYLIKDPNKKTEVTQNSKKEIKPDELTTYKEAVKIEIVSPKSQSSYHFSIPEKKQSNKIVTLTPKYEEKEPELQKIPQTKEKIEIKKDDFLSSKYSDTNKIDRFIKKFNKTNQFSDCLQVAKEYYEMQDYQNAIIWSLKANDLDKTKEDSWIIFVKSSIHLNKKDVARRAIDTFLQFKDSKELSQLKKGL